MSEVFRASYEINDGYAGESRPQYFTIRSDNLDFDDELSDDQIEELYEEMCYDEFVNNTTVSVNKLDEFKQWFKQLQKEKVVD